MSGLARQSTSIGQPEVYGAVILENDAAGGSAD